MKEIRIVEAKKVEELKKRANKFLTSPLMFPFGLLLRSFLRELELWEDVE